MTIGSTRFNNLLWKSMAAHHAPTSAQETAYTTQEQVKCFTQVLVALRFAHLVAISLI